MTPYPTGCVWWVFVAVVTLATTTMSQADENLVPDIPASQEESPLIHLWRQALRNQKGPDGVELPFAGPAPKTFIAPDYGIVVNWVPQDSPHPLYVAAYQPLLRTILKDYMVQEEVKPDDPRISQTSGLTVTNLNGKQIIFTKDQDGLKVNGVNVRESKVNEDGTVSYTLVDSLFQHREEVHTAWEEVLKTAPRYDPFGRPLGGSPRPPPPPPPTQ